MFSPTEAEVLKTLIASMCGLGAAVMTAWAGVQVARLKKEEDAPRSEAATPEQIAEATFAAFFSHIGDVDPSFWAAIRSLPRIQRMMLGRDEHPRDDASLAILLPQIAEDLAALRGHLNLLAQNGDVIKEAARLLKEKDEQTRRLPAGSSSP